MSKVVGFFILLALDVPAIILRGFVLVQLWGWFVIPLGLPAIGIAHALGIGLVASLFVNKSQRADNDERSFWEIGVSALLTSLMLSLLAWGVGAIVHGFM